jgi:hypothetical protein
MMIPNPPRSVSKVAAVIAALLVVHYIAIANYEWAAFMTVCTIVNTWGWRL